MKDCWFLDNNFDGFSDEIFNDVHFFDFPLEEVENDGLEEDWDAQLKHLEEPSFGVFSVSSSSGPCDDHKTQNEHSKLGRSFSASPAERYGPSNGKTIPKQNISHHGKDMHQFQTYSPVSVFESSSSSSVENSNFELPVIPVKGPRSKRQRLSSFGLSLLLLPESESDFHTQPAGKSSSGVKKKQRKKDTFFLSEDHIEKRSSSQESGTPRKCTHCEVTKTPQWREGPMGPKTLCNACGVRYRSGRLFPEYRPAASPTFVPSLHSNSHKKVIEMRTRAC